MLAIRCGICSSFPSISTGAIRFPMLFSWYIFWFNSARQGSLVALVCPVLVAFIGGLAAQVPVDLHVPRWASLTLGFDSAGRDEFSCSVPGFLGFAESVFGHWPSVTILHRNWHLCAAPWELRIIFESKLVCLANPTDNISFPGCCFRVKQVWQIRTDDSDYQEKKLLFHQPLNNMANARLEWGIVRMCSIRVESPWWLPERIHRLPVPMCGISTHW